MQGDVSVDLDRLEATFKVRLARRRAENVTTPSLDRDYFWSIATDEVLDVDAQPAALGVRQVTELLDWLALLRADHDRALPYRLVCLADVLRAVGAPAAPGFGSAR